MGIFSDSSPFDSKVEAATDGQKEDWAKIMDICDDARVSSQSAKDCLTSIWPRLRHQDPHIALQAITLLDACVNNCGKHFHLMVASRDFVTEYRKLLSKTKGEVRGKLLTVLRAWAEGEFSKDDQLNLIPSLCKSLRQEGLGFPNESQKSEKPASVPRETEDAELAKAIELSLKESSSPSNSSLYPSTSAMYPSAAIKSSSPPAGRKVRALYDFEAAEDGELTFKAGDIITVTEETVQSWWKGHTKSGEGLFPSSFVTSDLAAEPEKPKSETKRSVQFDEDVRVQKIVKEEVELDENKMDKLLLYLHEADPTDPSRDPPEMQDLADEVNAMGPLIDAELERVDSKHAQLTKLCMDLQGALNLYHSLMPDPVQPTHGPGPNYMPKPMGPPGPSYMPKPMGGPYYQQQPQMNGVPSGMMPGPYGPMPGGMPHPHPGHPAHAAPPGMGNGALPPHFIPGPNVRHPNGVPQYGPPPPGAQPPPGPYPMAPMAGPPQPGYHDKPPLL